MVTDPVIAYFAAAPVATCEFGKGLCTAFFRSNRTDVEGDFCDFFGLCSLGAPDNGETARSGQICFQRLEEVNTYRALIEASVCDFGLFGVGKKGVPSSAARWAL